MDFQPLSGSVVIPNGQASATITVTPIDDGLVEPVDETVIATLTTNYSAYSVGAASSATVSIHDAHTSTITVAATSSAASEVGPVPGTFTISRDRTQGAVTVYYTMSGTARDGIDYQTLSGSVLIPNGQSSVTLTVNPLDDGTVKGPETAVLTITPQPNAYWMAPPPTPRPPSISPPTTPS